MQVKDIMTEAVLSFSPQDLVVDAAEQLHKKNFTGAPVVNEFGVVVGVVTERELFTRDFSVYLPTYIKFFNQTEFIMGANKELPYEAGRLSKLKVEDVMSRDVFFVSPDMELEKLASKFAVQGMSVLPVTDQANKLLGVVSRTDLLKLFGGVALQTRSVHSQRLADQKVEYVGKDLASRFVLVTKARANIWVVTATVLFIVGFLAGVVYVVNPRIFSSSNAVIN